MAVSNVLADYSALKKETAFLHESVDFGLYEFEVGFRNCVTYDFSIVESVEILSQDANYQRHVHQSRYTL